MSDVRCPMSENIRYGHYRLVSDPNPTPTVVSHDIGHRTSDIGHLTYKLSERFETADASLALPTHDDGFRR